MQPAVAMMVTRSGDQDRFHRGVLGPVDQHGPGFFGRFIGDSDTLCMCVDPV